jgi:hypothetical protein
MDAITGTISAVVIFVILYKVSSFLEKEIGNQRKLK